jgi:flagellar basal-body rod protein FlgB
MTDLLDAQFGIHATALKLRSQRLDILASNIANAATPGYKARDLDFGAALTAAGNAQAAAAPSLRYRVPVQASLDGNTVELHVEQLQFAENSTRYEATLQFLSDRITGLRKVLRGE